MYMYCTLLTCSTDMPSHYKLCFHVSPVFFFCLFACLFKECCNTWQWSSNICCQFKWCSDLSRYMCMWIINCFILCCPSELHIFTLLMYIYTFDLSVLNSCSWDPVKFYPVKFYFSVKYIISIAHVYQLKQNNTTENSNNYMYSPKR